MAEIDDITARQQAEVELPANWDLLAGDDVGRKKELPSCRAGLDGADRSSQGQHGATHVPRLGVPQPAARIDAADDGSLWRVVSSSAAVVCRACDRGGASTKRAMLVLRGLIPKQRIGAGGSEAPAPAVGA
jgi:hypothetical protein